jgi:hypothetical protein
MTPYFILVTIAMPDWNKIDVDAFVKVLEKGQDYIGVAGMAWIIKTTSPVDVWFRRFEPLLPDDSQIFIVKIDLSERQGLLPKAAWDWIDRQAPPPFPFSLPTVPGIANPPKKTP